MQTQLKRSRNDQLLCGVLSGLANYLGVGVLITRIIFIILCFINGGFILAYIALAIILPVSAEDELVPREEAESDQNLSEEALFNGNAWKKSLKNSNVFFAILCIVVGVFSLIFRRSELFSFSSVGALLVIVTGFYLFSKNIIISTSDDHPEIKAYAMRRLIIGVILMVCGILWMLSIVGIIFLDIRSIFAAFIALWPVMLIGAGVSFLIRNKKVVGGVWLGISFILLAYAIYLAMGNSPLL